MQCSVYKDKGNIMSKCFDGAVSENRTRISYLLLCTVVSVDRFMSHLISCVFILF